MKSDKMGMGTLNKNEDLKELSEETKQTVATDTKQQDSNRSFGAVDMWNRQKRQRTSLQMRRWLR
ncbi:MAG: hypothetical protein H7211_07390 [Aquabacterium sp.]|nr:hypothetical protein [Ferruginibacter sp.]